MGRRRCVLEIRKKKGTQGKVRLQVLPDGTLQVTAPPHFDISPLLEQKKEWIAKKIENIERIVRGCDCAEAENLLLLEGRWYTLTHGTSCAISEDNVTYTTPGDLKRMLSGLLRKEIEEAITRNAPRIERTAGTITIRTQRTRWGSCSGKSTLNFNLVMMALPPSLREYIILHEIVHLRERNHSPSFWKRLEVLCPDYSIRRKELKKFWILVERNSIWKVLRTAV